MVDNFQLALAQSLKDSGKLSLQETSDNAVIHTSTGGRLQQRLGHHIRCILIHLSGDFLRCLFELMTISKIFLTRNMCFLRDKTLGQNRERMFDQLILDNLSGRHIVRSPV